MSDADDLLEVDGEGVARPLGVTAVHHLRARVGVMQVLPAPAHLAVLRQVSGPAAVDGRACLLAGELRTPGAICDIVSFVAHAGWRGELVVMDGLTSRSIYFDQGQVVGAASTVERERLGLVLYRYGILDEEQLQACSTAVDDGLMRFGEAAVRFGYVSRERLFNLMPRQTEEIFYGLVLVTTGMFYFLDGFEEAVLSSRQQLAVATLIREGVRRMHEMRYFRSRIPSDRHVPCAQEGRAPPETDPPGVFAAIDGQRTIADVCRVVGEGEFEVTRAVFQLVQAGCVAIRPPPLRPREAVETYNRAIAMILRELDAMDEGDDIRNQLAKFASTGGVYGALFAGAGPADDGTLNAGRIVENLARFESPAEAEEMIGRWLYEYASYALFLGRPHLRRSEETKRARMPAGERAAVSQRVAVILEPIAPAGTPLRGRPQR
jgi:hypothetical protein